MRAVSLLLLVLALSACQSLSKPDDDIPVKDGTTVKIKVDDTGALKNPCNTSRHIVGEDGSFLIPTSNCKVIHYWAKNGGVAMNPFKNTCYIFARFSDGSFTAQDIDMKICDAMKARGISAN